MRAYIEASDHDEDTGALIITVGDINWRVEIRNGLPWIYMQYNEEGDLVINNSALMENDKWDHITKELLRFEEYE